ncbi:MAG: class I SAM-dependent methyltransferase [Alcanivorax sp.]|nr:class I SAM-dependent methyltransferase [Alcanivorax sp.]
MTATNEQAIAGQAVYTKKVLFAYDILVLGISSSYIWKCPSKIIEQHYNRHISSNHLDVGVGTGYFLNRCQFPSSTPRIALMDMNPNSLDFVSRRIARHNPETWQQNILEKIESDIAPFDSVGVNYLFHCLPGAIEEKAVAFDHLKSVMKPGARIFGSTILQGGVKRGWAARKLMAIYNKKGIFDNTGDGVANLEAALRQRFEDVQLEVVGCVALFSARVGDEMSL